MSTPLTGPSGEHRRSSTATPRERVVQEGLQLLREAGVKAPPSSPGYADTRHPLQQCLSELESSTLAPGQPEPVRTLHQFACSGGTLISKCVAAMPNVQLLSEVDPLFPGAPNEGDQPKFTPSDMTALLRAGTRGSSEELIAKVFQASLRVVHDHAMEAGLYLVLRDHAHSHYCRGREVSDRPSLRALVASILPVRSLVTVRNPIDSYASLRRNGWIHFLPANFDTYCQRYNRFLDDHADLPIIRYEDLATAPAVTMQNICSTLELPYIDEFAALFSAFRISGDSGRSGDEISSRPRRTEADALLAEAEQSAAYRLLAFRLEYG